MISSESLALPALGSDDQIQVLLHARQTYSGKSACPLCIQLCDSLASSFIFKIRFDCSVVQECSLYIQILQVQ